MLVPLQEKDFHKYIDFAYELAMDPARTCYPIYYDGVKTRALFEADARKGISLPGDQILLYEEDGAIEGWLHYYYLPEDRYIAHRSCGVRRNTARALQELSEHLAARYPGCEWAVGFPSENQEGPILAHFDSALGDLFLLSSPLALCFFLLHIYSTLL